MPLKKTIPFPDPTALGSALAPSPPKSIETQSNSRQIDTGRSASLRIGQRSVMIHTSRSRRARENA
jgi:hypothetical protein